MLASSLPTVRVDHPIFDLERLTNIICMMHAPYSRGRQKHVCHVYEVSMFFEDTIYMLDFSAISAK